MVEATDPTTWRIELPHTTAAVPIARALVRTALTDRDAPADRDTAELLTAELVANAVEHTEGEDPIELIVELLPGGCQVEVHDRRPARAGDLILRPGPGEASEPGETPEPAETPDPWQEHGRGLMLIRALSSDCGHRPTARGKAVWFTLPAVPGQRRPVG
ncbi:ATP-binding protein [Streptomyces sp. NPDC003035]|uniref:ATP-binding protein n=1 Tax=Streptomyces sp. NPDC003035 TaxID=3364676 RepID=UPI0036C966AF